jgi:hypothetical protein
VVHGWVGEDILDTYTTERHSVAARLLQNTRAQIALMRPDPQTRALWEMFSDLMDLDDAHRYVANMLAGMDVRYDLGDDHRLVGTPVPGHESAGRSVGRPVGAVVGDWLVVWCWRWSWCR